MFPSACFGSWLGGRDHVEMGGSALCISGISSTYSWAAPLYYMGGWYIPCLISCSLTVCIWATPTYYLDRGYVPNISIVRLSLHSSKI